MDLPPWAMRESFCGMRFYPPPQTSPARGEGVFLVGGNASARTLPPLRHPLADRRLRVVKALAHHVDQRRLPALDGTREGQDELCRILDAPALDPEGRRDLGMVGAVEVDGVVAPAEAAFLPRFDPAIGGVGDDDHGHRHF